MLGELGFFALIAALMIALLQGVVSLLGVISRQPLLQQLAPSLALAQMLSLLVSFFCLMASFLTNDFSLIYVADHSNSLLPWYYQMSAVWGGHEGSLLLWVTILGLWSGAVALFSRALPLDMIARVLSILGMVSVAMIAFIVFTSNPFLRSLPMLPVDGADLNPLLQDVGLIIHPPMLYMGYVGLAVPFSFAMAGLWAGRLDSAWARWSRPWTLAAWSFLTVGIALGSWWAYYELGWGGWWFWDPVENASFMPWLAATALIHSLAVSEKRGVFKAWTVLLAILAFALSLLGTFLVRSGVLTSVHAFAADPSRGLFVLGILIAVVGGGLLLFALRGWKLTTESRYRLWSRETFLVVNNLILVVATTVVLLGTLYPLIADAFALGRVSVGAPYFNSLFVPLSWLLLVFMAIAPVTAWKQQSDRLRRELVLPAITVGLTALLAGGGLWLIVAGKHAAMTGFTVALCLWVCGFLLWDIWNKSKTAPNLWRGLRRLTLSYWGMVFAHLGLLVVIMGITLTTHLSIERDVALKQGQSVDLAGYHFHFDSLQGLKGPNYDATLATFSVRKEGEVVGMLYPEKRFYVAQNRPMTEAAIDGTFIRDLYVALGEPLDPNHPEGAWAVRVYCKPFVRWLWLGALMMGLGGGLAIMDRRYRLSKRGKNSGTATPHLEIT
ncbi:heme lyase CcmF/NrfE family subunit [Aquirhabdus parva]|uniref:Heme lyase CcmF/NrfE family subunit n=1 Tax=Aquirhabdus parva TaxID=2283318 RepID=A0A345P7B0_9GAMM|nr:heme lyase CcmF/NrfE family subunit [Aquirhabdus parva]AXI03169.1 heme lyase CcmF/NrfE family subunit [Aquirhabdus parva]